MNPIFAWLGNLFAGPIINGLLKFQQQKLDAGNTQASIAAGIAARELDTQRTEILAQNQLKRAEIGHPWEPEKLAMYITLVYYAKVVIWDVVLEGWTHGNTDALHGPVAVWAQLIMSFYFTKRGFENVALICKR